MEGDITCNWRLAYRTGCFPVEFSWRFLRIWKGLFFRRITLEADYGRTKGGRKEGQLVVVRKVIKRTQLHQGGATWEESEEMDVGHLWSEVCRAGEHFEEEGKSKRARENTDSMSAGFLGRCWDYQLVMTSQGKGLVLEEQCSGTPPLHHKVKLSS